MSDTDTFLNNAVLRPTRDYVALSRRDFRTLGPSPAQATMQARSSRVEKCNCQVERENRTYTFDSSTCYEFAQLLLNEDLSSWSYK